MRLKNIEFKYINLLFSFFIIIVFGCKTNSKIELPKKQKPFDITFDIKGSGDSTVLKIVNPTYAPLRFYLSSADSLTETIIRKNNVSELMVLGQETNIFNIKRADTTSSKTFRKKLSVDVKYGDLNNLIKDTVIALPYPKNKTHTVLQGNKTTFTHKYEYNKYAVDFKMNIGEEISAVYNGVVVAVLDQYNIGGANSRYQPYGNYIMLYHKDLGTYSEYFHLKFNGSLVKIGDEVKQGQIIGYSGNTGHSTEPHLHFNYSKPHKKEGLISIPIRFNSGHNSIDLTKHQKIKND